MCFSAQASFGASALLGLIGLYSLRKAHKDEQSLATVPLLFALQQACEGIVWSTYTNPEFAALTNAATYAFCFFAFFIWPVWIPFTALCLEKIHKRKQFLWSLLFLGSAVSGGLMFFVIRYGIGLEISCSHIKYGLTLPENLNTAGVIVYCLATITPFFISSKRWMPLFGVLAAASVSISSYFYTTYFISVWCFFAALLSGIIACIV